MGNEKFDKRKKHYGPRVNERIRIKQIRVINDDGKMLGIMSPQEALEIAKGQGLDLVEIVPTARPPVCKIIEYGKYKYEQSKKQNSSATKKSKFKEIKFHPRIDEHDYQTKLKKISSFLEKGNQVRIAVEFRGREMQYREHGNDLLNRVISDVGELCKTNTPLTFAGRRVSTNLSPAKSQNV
jgi:translation initiation factor IF-3